MMCRCTVVVVVLMLLASCRNESPPGPPPQPPLPKDPRTYTWTVDTLWHPESFQTAMMRIWGSSPNNVYLVGHNDVGKRKMYRFNGQQWSVVPITQNEGGPILRPSPFDVFGFSASDIYAVGTRYWENPNPPPFAIDSSLIIHFNGVQWTEIPTNARGLWCIGGNSSGVAYAAGYGTVGFYLVAGTHHPDTIPIPHPANANFGVNTLAVTPAGGVYANGSWTLGFEERYYFLHRSSGGLWTILDTAVIQPDHVEIKWGYNKLWYSTWRYLYSVHGGGAFSWNGSTWDRIFDGYNGVALSDIKGRSATDLFVCGHFGLLFHFDGRDWHQFQQFANYDLVLTGLLVFDSEVFVVGTDAGGSRSFILHGK